MELLTIIILSLIIIVLGFLLYVESGKNVKNLKSFQSSIEKIEKDKIAAQNSNNAKSCFLANMSHEIRTLLNGIEGFGELLKQSGLKDEQREFVEIMEKSSQNLLEIVNNVLDFSKIESKKIEIQSAVFIPMFEFESVVNIFTLRASDKNIDFVCFIDPTLEHPLMGDSTKIKEILVNLLSNALKFSNHFGYVHVDIRKVVSQEIGKTKIRFEVQDNGIGIAPEESFKVFEPFTQANHSVKLKYGGTGLGLSISHFLVALMGGKLDLQSKEGEGTTLCFTLELDDAEVISSSSRCIFDGLEVLVLNHLSKGKKQARYLREYLQYFGVEYTDVEDVDKLFDLKESSCDFIFVDYDSLTKEVIVKLANLPQKLVVFAKANEIKIVQTLPLKIFKIVFEPFCYLKLKHIFENYLPMEPVQKEVQNKLESHRVKFNPKILAAEDNVINQKLLKHIVEDFGAAIVFVDDGQEAVKKVQEGCFDIIFMDIEMPLLDGIKATSHILEWERLYHKVHVPIIALTANALKGDREKFLSLGFDGYIAKPLSRHEIFSLLKSFVPNGLVEMPIFKEGVADTSS